MSFFGIKSDGRGDLVRGDGGPYSHAWKKSPAKLTPKELLENASARVEETTRFVIEAEKYLLNSINDPKFGDTQVNRDNPHDRLARAKKNNADAVKIYRELRLRNQHLVNVTNINKEKGSSMFSFLKSKGTQGARGSKGTPQPTVVDEVVVGGINKIKVKKPVKKPIKKPVKKPVKKPIKKPIKKPVKKPIKKPIKKPVKKPIKKPIKKPVVKSTKKKVSPTRMLKLKTIKLF